MSPILGIIASANQQGRGGGPESGYDALATVTVPSGGVASVTFAGIPTGYKHLQVRIIGKTNRALNRDGAKVTFNSDTSSSYVDHYLYGTGSSAAAGYDAAAPASGIYRLSGNTDASNIFGAIVYDILDYANTNKNKTCRYLGGVDLNGAGEIYFGSNLYMKTDAISSITFAPLVGTSFLEYSQFALYGIK
jgi:hypothetical protein